MSTERQPNYGYNSSGALPVAIIAATPTVVDPTNTRGAVRRIRLLNHGTGSTETIALELEIMGEYGPAIHVLPQSQFDSGDDLAGITKMRLTAGAGGAVYSYYAVPEPMTYL